MADTTTQTGNNCFISENFFCIASDNLETPRSRLIGFAFDGNNLYLNHCCGKRLPDDCTGSYINILVENDHILIQQDSISSYGIYIYKDKDYFAISNSIVYLIDYLAGNHVLTPNYDYISIFLQFHNTITYTETIISEISILPQNADILIDINNRHLSIDQRYIKDHCVPIDSPETFALLDEWQSRWSSLLACLLQTGQDVEFGLSGGRDSRAVLSIIDNNKVDLQSICFFNQSGNAHTYRDDRVLAEKIGAIYGFALNQCPNTETINYSRKIAYFLSFLAEGLSHPLYRGSITGWKRPHFRFGGWASEAHRDVWDGSAENIVNNPNLINISNGALRDARFALLKRVLHEMEIYHTKEISGAQIFQNKHMISFHSGRGAVEEYLFNAVNLCPLADGKLLRIAQKYEQNFDRNLLFAVIITRYLPEISHLGYDSGHLTAPETLNLAKTLSDKYPRKFWETNVELIEKARHLPLDVEACIFDFLKPENSGIEEHAEEACNIFGYGFLKDVISSYEKLAANKRVYLLRKLEAALWAMIKCDCKLPANMR